MSSDVFRPRLPLDPFHNPYSQPEYINPDSPWPTYHFSAKSAVFSVQPHVLLVLGAPSAHALAPILRSPTFARSLLLLVTHNPPPLSALAHARPTITILRLDGPLLPAAPAFALTLVQVLDAAAAVARAWSGLPHDIQQLAQDPAGAFTVREPLTPDSLPISVSHHHRPARRTSRLADPPPPPPPPPPLNPPLSPIRRPTPTRASSSLSLTKLPLPKRPTSTLAPSPASLRPFDAILSFLPPLQPERAVLKQVVLTTTLAAPFLAGSTRSASASASAFDLRWVPPSPGYGYEGSIASSESANPEGRRRRSRFSSLFGTGTSTGTRSVPATRPSSASISGFTYTNTNTNTNNTHDEGAAAYIIHVLPSSYRSAKLEGALGAFVASASVNSTGTRGYVLAERALRDLECLLVGALHTEGEEKEEEKGEGMGMGGRGAWVAGVLNVVTPPAASGTAGGGEAVEVDAEPGGEYGNGKEKHPPFGLPTPPASRHGSREGAGEVEGEEELSVSGALEQRQERQGNGGRRKASVSLPSSSASRQTQIQTHPHAQTQPTSEYASATPRPHAPSVSLPSSSSPHPHPHPTSSSATPRAHARNPTSSSSVSGSGGQGKLRRASGRRPPSAAEGAMRRADSAPGPTAHPSSHPSSTPAEVPQTRKSGRRRDTLKAKDKEKDRGKFFGGKGPGDFSLRGSTTLPLPVGERRKWWALWS